MPVTWFDGVTVTAEIALVTDGGPYAQWGNASYGWGVGQWAPGITYVDVSGDLRRWTSSRMFRDDGSWPGGTGSLSLLNNTGAYSADNPGSPYVVSGLSSMLPWRPARLTLTVGGVDYRIMQMLTKPWDEGDANPAPSGGGVDTVDVGLVDEWARVAKAGAPGAASAGAGELSGPRYHRILDAAGHRAPRDIDPGTMTMQATTLTTEPTRELQLTADSEGGHVWDEIGTATARDRRHLIEDTRSATVQATFSGEPTGTEVHYRSYRTLPVGSAVHTSAAFTRVGGTQQAFTDHRAQAIYGVLRAARADLLNDSDDDVLRLAKWRVAMDASSRPAVSEITVQPRKHGGTGMATYLALRMWDLVKVVRHRPGGYTSERYGHVAGIAHDMDYRGNWSIRFRLTDATVPLSYAGSGWGVGTWGTSSSDPTACKWVPG